MREEADDVNDDTAEIEVIDAVKARTVTDTDVRAEILELTTAPSLIARSLNPTPSPLATLLPTLTLRAILTLRPTASWARLTRSPIISSRGVTRPCTSSLSSTVTPRNTKKLKRDNTSEAETLSRLERGELAAQASLGKISKCVVAIVHLLGTTAIPAAKLLRIKKCIKALGGTKQAIKLVLGATSPAEKLKVGGQALAAELLGISTVKNNCLQGRRNMDGIARVTRGDTFLKFRKD